MISRLSIAAAAVLLCALPAGAQSPEGGPWLLQRLYAPRSPPHDPFRFWLSGPDLAAATGQPRPRVRMLMLNDDGGWSVIATEFRCGENLFRRTEGRRLDSAGQVMFADPYPPDYFTPGVLDPEYLVYGVVCDGEPAGVEEIITVAEGREREAEDRERSLVAIAAAEAARPVEDAPCRGNVLRNPFFAIPTDEPATGRGVPIERTFMGLSQTLWAWRATAGGAPRWPSPESPGEGPLYLDEGQSIVQPDVRTSAGRWRLTVVASATETPRSLLRVGFGAEDDTVFDFDLPDAPTQGVAEVELAEPEDRLSFTAVGPGEIRLQMACLKRLD